MRLPTDTILHLKGGLGVAACLAIVAAAAVLGWPGIGVAVGAAIIGWGVERYQAIRGEGTASNRDMIASALPGVVLGLAYEAWRALP